MNKLQSIAAISACSLAMFAQAQNQMFSESNIWSCYDHVSKQNHKYQSSGNINVNGRNFQKLYMAAGDQPFEFDLEQSNMIGALREDGQKIWFLPVGASDPYLLYDYSLQVGAQFNMNVFEPIGVDQYQVSTRAAQVYKVENTNVMGMMKRKLYISSPEMINALPESEHFRLDPFADIWIEGVGSNAGLISRMPAGGNAINDLPRLNCLTKSGNIIFANTLGHQTASNDPCFVIPESFNLDVYLGHAEDPTSLRSLVNSLPKIYPNPVENIARVSNLANRSLYHVVILNTSGVRVFDEEIMSHNGQMSIDLSHLNRGVYFIKLTEAGNGFTLRFMKM